MRLQSSELSFQLSALRPFLTCYAFRRLVDCYAAYFGSLTCVAWSPDGRFIIVSLIHPSILLLTVLTFPFDCRQAAKTISSISTHLGNKE